MSDKPDHKSTYYSGKKPYLVHNYRTMMRKKTQEEYYSHELHQDPMSELLKPYWHRPDILGFGWEYMGPPGYDWSWPPFDVPGGGGGFGGGIPPYYPEDDIPEQWVCDKCDLLGNDTVWCGAAWVGQVVPSECIGWNVFAYGLDDGTNFDTAGNASGAIVVVVPSDTTETAMLVCSSSPPPGGVTCCRKVTIECCCEGMALTGDDTVNPDGDWVGTIDPPCPAATCAVTSNSGCGFSCVVSGDGSQVTVSIGASDCGGLTVTLTGPCEESASKTVRINNTGQGGSWTPSCGNWTTQNCPRTGCPVEEVLFGDVKAELKCGNLGADCKAKTGCRTATGSEWCAGNEYCWTNACCTCDGINQTTLWLWNCTC